MESIKIYLYSENILRQSNQFMMLNRLSKANLMRIL